MKIRLYFDEDSMQRSLVDALRARGMDVRTALEDRMIEQTDSAHLDHATQQGRVLFSFNRGDFYRLHTAYLAEGRRHTGIILANQQQYTVGELMRRMLQLAATKSAQDIRNQIEFLSAW